MKIVDEGIILEDHFWSKLKIHLTRKFYTRDRSGDGCFFDNSCRKWRDLCPQNILHGKWPQRICVKLGRDGLACIEFHFNETDRFGPDDGNFSTGYFKYEKFSEAAEVIREKFSDYF
eukprot:GHVP01034743.1.p1 GENE.GHVP01034743.1~~GHVP01034743.1.p1  ORF type:complete len:117 (+),score=16.44 GHVP01034743.1:318-668(+)